jgi:hypothetical protein
MAYYRIMIIEGQKSFDPELSIAIIDLSTSYLYLGVDLVIS